MLLPWSFIEVDVWFVLYKVALFKILFRVISLIEFFMLIAIYMYILDSLIVSRRQASTEKALITIFEKISLSDLRKWDMVDERNLEKT